VHLGHLTLEVGDAFGSSLMIEQKVLEIVSHIRRDRSFGDVPCLRYPAHTCQPMKKAPHDLPLSKPLGAEL
jgi:hypothetical protein